MNEPVSPSALLPVTVDAIVKSTRESLSQALVQAAIKDKLLSKDPGLVVRALETDNVELRDLVREAVSAAAAMDGNLIAKTLQAAANPNADETRASAIIILAGMLAGTRSESMYSTLTQLCNLSLAKEKTQLALATALAEVSFHLIIIIIICFCVVWTLVELTCSLRSFTGEKNRHSHFVAWTAIHL